MKKINGIRWIALTVVFVLVSLLWMQSTYSQEDNEKQISSIYSEHEKVIVEDKLELSFNIDKGNFIVRNMEDGTVWKSFLEENDIQSERKPNEKWLEAM